MKLKAKSIFTVILLVITIFTLTACNGLTLSSEFEVTFNSNGGSSVASIQDVVGSNILEPEAPERTDYEFMGWYYDEGLTQVVEWPIILARDYELFAKWSFIGTDATLSFDCDEGSQVDEITVAVGTSVVEPNNPTKTDYTFMGWFFDEDLTEPVTWPLKLDQNYILYAKWEAILEAQVSLIFETNEGSVIDTVTVSMGSSVSKPNDPTKTDYVFMGWYYNISLTDAVVWPIVLTQDTTIYAKWETGASDRAFITFETNGGTIPYGGYTIYVSAGSIVQYFEASEKEGYNFVGWYYDEALENVIVYPVTINSSLTIYAKWEIDMSQQSTIIFETNGGSSMSSITQMNNSSIEAPNAPTKDGYNFVGWYYDETFTQLVAWPMTLTQSMTLYAKWQASTSSDAILSFETDGGSHPYGGYIVKVVIGTSLDSIASSERFGYDFVGWYYDEDLTNPVIYPVTINADTTFYAKWEAISSGEPIVYSIDALNDIFEYDVYDTLPAFVTSDAQIVDTTYDVGYTYVKLYIYDWTSSQYSGYINVIDARFSKEYESPIYIADIEKGLYLTIEKTNASPKGIENTVCITLYQIPEIDYATLSAYFDFDVTSILPELHAMEYDITQTERGIKVYLLGDWANDYFVRYGSYQAILTTYFERIPDEIPFIVDADQGYYLLFSSDRKSSLGSDISVPYFEFYMDEPYVPYDPNNPKNRDEIDMTLISDYFGFGLYEVIPNIYSEDYSMHAIHLGNPIELVVELHDWDDVDYLTYRSRCDDLYEYMSGNGYILGDNLMLYVNAWQSPYTGRFEFYANIYTKGPIDISLYPEVYNFGETLDVGNVEVLSDIVHVDPLTEIALYDYAFYGTTPTTGTMEYLVVPVEVDGHPFDANYMTVLDLMFNGTSAETGWESVASYYQKSSFGQLNLSFKIMEKYQSIYGADYYADDLPRSETIVQEVLMSIDDQVDFSRYDYDHNGYIDNVIFIHSVPRGDWATQWWAYVQSAYSFVSGSPELDGKNLAAYMFAGYDFMNTYYMDNGQTYNARTYIHEFGHLLGAADYYSSQYDYGPVGGFDMMDHNQGDHGPLNKLLFDWIDPLVAYRGYTYQVTLDSYALDDNGINSALLIPFTKAAFVIDQNIYIEYLLIMYYTPDGLYEPFSLMSDGLQMEGIVIYHVYGYISADGRFLYDNFEDEPYFIELLEADMNDSLPGGIQINMNDVLTEGNLDLSYYTWFNGSDIDVIVTVDEMNGQTATITVDVR